MIRQGQRRSYSVSIHPSDFFFKSIYSTIIESSLLCCPSNNVGFGDYKSLGTETTQKREREEERGKKEEGSRTVGLGWGDKS